MFKLKYTGPYNASLWTVPTYREIVTVKDRYCTVKYPETVRALQLRGFELVKEPQVAPKKEDIKPAKPTPRPKPTLTRAESKILELLAKGANLNAIAMATKWKKSKIEKWILAHSKLVNEVVSEAGSTK